jgi:putative flippase GtrA
MTRLFSDLINFFLELIFPIFKKWMPFQVYAYLAVGAGNTLLNILLFVAVYQFILPQGDILFFGISVASYTLALLIAFLLTVPTGFWLSKNFAFTEAANNTKANRNQLGRYFLVVVQGLISDFVILKLLIEAGGLNPNLAKLLSTIIVLTVNYLLQKYFTFKTRQPGVNI